MCRGSWRWRWRSGWCGDGCWSRGRCGGGSSGCACSGWGRNGARLGCRGRNCWGGSGGIAAASGCQHECQEQGCKQAVEPYRAGEPHWNTPPCCPTGLVPTWEEPDGATKNPALLEPGPGVPRRGGAEGRLEPTPFMRRVGLCIPGQVSWLMDRCVRPLPIPSGTVVSCRPAPQLQWRYRGGFTPPSLLDPAGTQDCLLDC